MALVAFYRTQASTRLTAIVDTISVRFRYLSNGFSRPY